MAEIPEPGGDKPAPSGSGLSTVGSGNTGDLSGKTLVGQSSLDTVDLSGTIQDPDAQPANTGQAVPGTSVGVPGGLELPKTPGTFIDLSGIGRPLPKDKRPLDPRPEDNAPLPNPSFEPLDISKFTNPDGTTDWARIGAILSMRAQLKAQERRARRRMQPRPPREKPAQPQGKSEDAQNQGKSQAAKRPGIGNEAGRRFRRYHRAYRQRNSSLAFLSKRGIEVKSLSDIAEKTTPLASPEDSGKTRLPSPGGGVDEKSDRSHATNPREPEEEADFGGAPPVGTKQKPLPSGDKISPSRSEVFRRLAKKPARSRTMQQKLRQWIQDNRSSGKRTAAEKNEGQVERELMNARKRHIAWIEDEKRAANDLIKNETDGNAVIVLNKAIERLDRHLKEASELEEKRANRNILKDHLELETSPTIKRKFQDQLKELNLQIENEEGKERIRLKRHMSGDLASAAEVRKVADMTPAERAAFNARSGQSFTTVASRPPGQLEQSSAERALREKWIREDKPHEDAVMKIEFMSDSKEKMDAWKALQRVRSSLLLKRRKELQKLWRKQADEMKADREFAWSEEEDDAEGKGVPGTEHSSQGKIGDTGSGSGVKDVAQAKLDKAKAQLAKDLEKKQAEEAENAKKIEEAKKLAALKKTPGSPTGMDSLPSYFRQKKQNPPGIEPPRFPDLPGMRGGSGLSGGEGAKLRRPGQPDLPGRGGTAPANPENTTPPPIPVPFTAKTPLSPIQERRSEPVAYETHPGVARFLGNMAAERIRKEMLAEGLESADLDEMKQEDEFTKIPELLGRSGYGGEEKARENGEEKARQNGEEKARKRNGGEGKAGEGKARKRNGGEGKAGKAGRNKLDEEVERQQNGKQMEEEKCDREGDALKDQEKEVQDYMTKLKNKLEEIALGKNDLEESFEQRERELNEQRIKEESEMRERERERILAAQRKKEEIESKPRKERDLRWILEKEMKELQEAADLEQLGDDEDELSDELSLFQTTSLKLRVPGLSWLGRTDPEFSDEDSRSDSSQHSLFDVTDEDSDFLDLSTPPPGPSDAKPSPDAPGSTRAKAPKEPKIHLHLTIFTSPTQFLSDVSPLHFVCCENVRLSWKISQLIDYLRAPTEVKTNPGKLIQEVPGCVGFRKEDGEVIEEGSWEVKNMRLRIGRRWLDRENRTLLEEGLRDWDNVVVLMVGEGENIEEGDWKDCVWEADGVAGWREGWPGVGKARVPKDREDWVGILWDDYFMVTY
ncbi:01f97a4c-2a46-46c6-9935-d0a6ea61eda8 [Sclerotinia trifoliorum]|uniref:01f97a4c-2a46-46c6-9935-d0a6ea61eda8 n=1 Tax=Sclerotinia trifoliorum TaxID=28548 RepID=A0A8H2VYP1_9HELO|nr:01f97a4c-2a46-46c6-9935-d0a6ea61eda8 [Sclerotinia trifoliorum]